jgi:hypothetical protein
MVQYRLNNSFAFLCLNKINNKLKRITFIEINIKKLYEKISIFS